MEGFWTVEFQGVEGMGNGLATLIDGHLFGGDNGYLYIGTYTRQGNAISTRVHVKRFVAGIANVMGRSEFDLQLSGTLSGNRITVEGTVPGTPLQLHAILTKQRDLPTHAGPSVAEFSPR